MSRTPLVVVASLLVGLIVGFATGWLLSEEKKGSRTKSSGGSSSLLASNRTPLEEQLAVVTAERDLSRKSAASAQTELSAAREKIASLEKSPAVAIGAADPADEAALTEEQKKAKIAEIEKALSAAMEKGDGKAILALLKDLAALGETAFPKVGELLGQIFKDMEGDKKLKIVQTDLFMLLSSKTFLPYSKWELSNTSLPVIARRGAVWSMMWSPDPSAPEFLAADLKEEKDHLVAKTIMDCFQMRNDPKSEEAILGVLETRRDSKEIRMDAVNALWNMGDEAAMKALTKASQGDSDSDVREAARIASKGIDPPVAGYMVNYVDTDSGIAAAGLKRGDIILSYNSESVQDSNALTTQSGKTEGVAQVPVQIYRDGQTVNLNVKGGVLDVWGRYVKPKH